MGAFEETVQGLEDSLLTPEHTVLTAKRVNEVMVDCLFRDGEDTTGQIIAEGILNPFGFHPGRLASHRQDIWEMLMQLPTDFRQSGGGGWSFLNACDTRHGNRWTGLHKVMDYLFALGLAVGLVKCVLPREMWSALPGGMPYYIVLDRAAV